MNINGWRRDKAKAGAIELRIAGEMAQALRRVHAASQVGMECGGRSSLEQYIFEILDNFLMERRSGRVPHDPTRHHERLGDETETHAMYHGL